MQETANFLRVISDAFPLLDSHLPCAALIPASFMVETTVKDTKCGSYFKHRLAGRIATCRAEVEGDTVAGDSAAANLPDCGELGVNSCRQLT